MFSLGAGFSQTEGSRFQQCTLAHTDARSKTAHCFCWSFAGLLLPHFE